MKYLLTYLLIIICFSCTVKEDDKSPKIVKKSSILFDKYLKNKNNQNNNFYLDESFKILKNEANSEYKRSLLSKIILEYYNNDNVEKLDESTKLLLLISNKSLDSSHIAIASRSRGNYYYRISKFDSSYYYYIRSEKIYLKLKDTISYSTILMNKGIAQYSVGDYLGAQLSLEKANLLFKKTKNFSKIYGSYNQLGLVAIELKDYEKGLFYYNKALESIKSLSPKEDVTFFSTVCNNNIGYLYLKSEDYKNAIEYFQEGLKNKSIVTVDPDLYANLLDNLAYCRSKLKINYQLPEMFFKALKIREGLNQSQEIVVSNIHLSEYFHLNNNDEKAIFYSKKALNEAIKSNSPLSIIVSLKQASLVDKENSSKYSKDYIRIADSLQIEERNSKDRFARIALETDELRKEKDSLIEQNRDILNYFMGTMAFVGVLFFMRAQRARRRELALTQAQQRANEELYKLIISQQNKLDEGKVYEKNRIAKELHDGVLGRMFGLRLNLDGLNKRTDEEAVQERLRYLEELKTIEQDLREISHELSREKFVLINNFVAIVNGLLEEQTKVNPAKLTATIGENIDWDKLSNTTKINLYRILQESLQNINKYANANFIKVDFKKDKKGNLILNIVDDGEGYDLNMKSKGIGMKNMVDRTHESNGTIEIKSEKDKGTQVLVVVPLEHKTIKV
ncbi:tetratricopeptide repeat-containing sensor histidine kinase [Flavobacterium sp.]|uniref:tetratricopeptide repeat-containing sensor histidine kinase n=1 Tax=Flavobacterium sp. TaxID=239 RepID=UPI0026066A57|nr:tetratricopeptide repeat-containing sensor histidine kinase [Flavobacterium sp.]